MNADLVPRDDEPGDESEQSFMDVYSLIEQDPFLNALTNLGSNISGVRHSSEMEALNKFSLEKICHILVNPKLIIEVLKDNGLKDVTSNLAAYANSSIEEEKGDFSDTTYNLIIKAFLDFHKNLIESSKQIILSGIPNNSLETCMSLFGILSSTNILEIASNKRQVSIKTSRIFNHESNIYISEEDALIFIAAGIRIKQIGIKMATDSIHDSDDEESSSIGRLYNQKHEGELRRRPSEKIAALHIAMRLVRFFSIYEYTDPEIFSLSKVDMERVFEFGHDPIIEEQLHKIVCIGYDEELLSRWLNGELIEQIIRY